MRLVPNSFHLTEHGDKGEPGYPHGGGTTKRGSFTMQRGYRRRHADPVSKEFDPEACVGDPVCRRREPTATQRTKMIRTLETLDRALHDPEIGAALWSILSSGTPATIRQQLRELEDPKGPKQLVLTERR